MSQGEKETREDPLSDPLPTSPLPTLRRWFEEARASPALRNHDAMALATTDAEGRPEVRFVLCRFFDEERGAFSFFTNYRSPKARALEGAGVASAAIYWDPLGRQVRISGRVRRSAEAESDAYFAGRHPNSQLAAWASAQSQPIESRLRLEARLAEARADHGDGAADRPIPRPAHWGGYTLEADRIELWADRAGRLHDRAVWSRDLGFPPSRSNLSGVWRVERLQP